MSDASKLSTGQSPHQSAAQLWLDRPDTGARQSLHQTQGYPILLGHGGDDYAADRKAHSAHAS